MCRKILRIVLMLGIASFCAFNCDLVLADGFVPGSNPNGGECNGGDSYYFDTCFGLSWQKYEVIEDLPADGVHFYYTPNSGGPINIRGCKKGQYVYNYGYEVYKNGVSTGYQASTQRNKSLPQAPHSPEAKGAYNGGLNNDTTAGYLRVVGYASAIEAENGFKKMIEYLKTHPDVPFAGNFHTTWDMVGAFCYSEEADGSEFEGKTEVSGAANKVVGYSSTTKTEFANIENCSVVEGCKVSFSHSLKRTSGDGTTDYTVSRSSNFIETGSSNKAIAANSKVKVGTFGSTEAQVSSSGEWTLYPGMVVCEKLEFNPSDSDTSKAYTRVCARALGSAETSLEMKVKNNTVAKYDDYSEEVYAKPGDNVTYQAKYSPVVQYTRRVRPETMKINNEFSITNGKPCATVVPTSVLLGYCQLEVLYNGKKGGALANWNNGFTVFAEKGVSYSADYRFGLGDDTEKIETNDYTVLMNDVGEELVEKAETNKNDIMKSAPKSVSFVAGTNKISTADVNVAANLDMNNVVSDAVKVYVPYNFINKTSITEIDKTVYAGEKVNIEYEVTTDLRQNEVLGDTYATVAKDAKWRLEVCYGDDYENCYTSEENTGELHKNVSIWESATKNDESTSDSINVPDLPAGTKIRMRSAVYPKDSGPDNNLVKDYYNPDDISSWAYSEWTELTIAKKPNFQVWGGGIYSAGKINVPVANKTTLAGIGTGNYMFGSWAELGVIASDKVNGLASGAGLGYASTSDAGLVSSLEEVEGLGGGNNTTFCKVSTLSFANNECNNYVGNLKGLASIDKLALVSDFVQESGFEVSGDTVFLDMDEAKYEVGDGLYYYHSSGDLTVSGASVKKGKTKVIKSEGTILIRGDIYYDFSDTYETISQIPRVIIYAKNIKIGCNVGQVDAILVAENNIDTCVDKYGNVPDENSKARSNQLKINGAVISDTLTLNRTYGAVTGVNSIIPAEIIDYDASLYLWANARTDVVKTGKIMTAYQKELSPRY